MRGENARSERKRRRDWELWEENRKRKRRRGRARYG